MSKDNRTMREKYKQNLLEYIDIKHTPPCDFTLFCDGYRLAQKEMQEKLDAAIEHINKLLEGAEDQCRFDHNGNCQDHGWFAYDNSCHVASARDFLKARGE